VELLDMRASPQGIADDGVFIDTDQAGRLADAAAIVKVLANGQGPFRGQTGVKEDGALALGETLLTGAAGEHPQALLAIVEADAQVGPAPQAVVGTFRVLATERAEIVQERSSAGKADY
jgi:hypothetical protein